jgi:hypothetical protein
MGDIAFRFFLALFRKAKAVQTCPYLHLNLENVLQMSTFEIKQDQSLLDMWLDLFKSADDTPAPKVEAIDAELELQLQLDNFDSIVGHFAKIHLSELIHKFKEELPRKKKQALRPSLQSLQSRTCTNPPKGTTALTTKKRKATDAPTCVKITSSVQDTTASTSIDSIMETVPQAEQSTQIPDKEPEVEDIYPCGICDQVCKDEPSTVGEESIACDLCKSWFHYGCANISGTEIFLRNKRSKWFCVKCNQKGKGKGKKKK